MLYLLSILFFLSTTLASLTKRNTNWDYQNDKIKGISLGGWFLLEPFITPSLFEQFGADETTIPVDEYTFTKRLGKEAASAQLEKHWSEWIKEEDFRDIKQYGFNLVRIPIGYWAFSMLDDDPYVQGQKKYFDQALEWARKFDLKVWFDLHGLPGSQNGFDNSGKRGDVNWFAKDEHVELSYKVLNYIYETYGGDNYMDTIIGIEVVNEPMGPRLDEDRLLQFYYNSYDNFRNVYESSNTLVLQEAFRAIGYWNEHFNNDHLNVSKKYSNITNFHDVVFDHHHYEVFTKGELSKSANIRALDIKAYANSIGLTQKYHPSLVGEWSGAITDCAKWLNGVGTGARYDDTFDESQLVRNSPPDTSKQTVLQKSNTKATEARSCSKVLKYEDFSEEHKQNIRKFIEVQLIEYTSQTSGWIFWNYKTENAIEWSFKHLHQHGLFPSGLTAYEYYYVNGTSINNWENGASSMKYSVTSLFVGLLLVLTLYV